MSNPQSGILADVPALARYIQLSIHPDGDPRAALERLARSVDGDATVVGFGASLLRYFGAEVPGIRVHPALALKGVDIPSTPGALWLWLRGDDRGELVVRSRQLLADLDTGFSPDSIFDAFKYGEGRDLSGYEDGTENPTGDDAVKAAICPECEGCPGGSSFVAVQQWIHDLDMFEAMGAARRDDTIGRRLSDNEELTEAPASAHVKRTAQEDFDPPAFVLRRSMPWADESSEGLVFVAFGKSFDAFEALLHRMSGQEDGVMDGLFSFTRPVTGAYFWCPPVAADGQLDLSALGQRA